MTTLALATAAFSPAFAASSADQWASYGHDASNMRYSPLRQINPGNVDRLTPAWTFHMRPASLDVAAANPQTDGQERGRIGRGRYIGSEMTPLVVEGLMFLATPYRRITAINATTGRQVWAYDLPGSDAPATRGLAYWPG